MFCPSMILACSSFVLTLFNVVEEMDSSLHFSDKWAGLNMHERTLLNLSGMQATFAYVYST